MANNHYLLIYPGLIQSGLFKAVTIKKVLIFSTFFYALILFNSASYAQEIYCSPKHINESAVVKTVYDGDTLQLDDGRKVRLLGIDTPEIFSKKRAIASDIKSSGERARVSLLQQLATSKNRVSLSYGAERFDRYGRTLAHVFLPDGKNLQAWLILEGYAIAFTTPPNDQMTHCYRRLELVAQQAKRGIWQMSQYQLKKSHKLSKKSQGFHRLQGRISRVSVNRNKVTLVLDDRLDLNIYKSDMKNFNAYQLNELQGKNVRVRGWIKHKKTHADKHKGEKSGNLYAMTLRHADALTLD